MSLRDLSPVSGLLGNSRPKYARPRFDDDSFTSPRHFTSTTVDRRHHFHRSLARTVLALAVVVGILIVAVVLTLTLTLKTA
jgi:hypothetical protein